MSDTPDQLPIKTRQQDHGRFYCETYTGQYVPGGVLWFSPSVYDQRVKTVQKTASQGHPWSRSNDYPGEDIGGPFETSRRYLALDPYGEKPIKLDQIDKLALSTMAEGGGQYYRMYGHLLPTSYILSSNQDDAWPLPEPSSNAELQAWGTKAIALTKPTNSIANLSVSLAELMREGLPKSPGVSQWEERARIARGAGSEYLNLQFGWLPLVSDIQDVAKAMSQSDKIWKQYQRDNGRLVRRRFEFKPVISEPVVVSSAKSYPFPSLTTAYFETGSGGGDLTITRHKRVRRWFSGAFTYHIPDRDADSRVERLLAASAKARKLYGLTLDPEVLWNLTPWSWAADWFANTGDVISNLTDMATDGLVLRYGYMMEESIISHCHSLENLKWRSTPPGPPVLRYYCVTKTLKRVRATPYGFGLTWESFTPRQLAILAALGVTRGR